MLLTIAFWASSAFGNSIDVPSSLRSREYDSPSSSTTPSRPSMLTRSPSRIGWLNASTMPATTFESVPCAARPMTTATTAVEAKTALA